jgi:aminocarboxymuconate-semialdehyde decarboxylase
VIGRLDYAYELLDFSAFLGKYEPVLIKHPPRHYLKMLYMDSACYWAPAAECALKSVGEDHFLFGTDSPPMVPLKQKGFDLMKNIGMTDAQYAKVMGGNAARLLKLN